MAQPAFLFDIGNVLLRFDFSVAARRFAERSDAEADEVISQLSLFKDDLESGIMPDAEFVRLSTERIGFRGTPEEFAHIWSDIFTENEPMVRLVEEMADRYPLYLLSNTNGLHKTFFLERFPFFRHFQGGIYSHEVRSMKPHEPIYLNALEKYRLEPGSTYYIDDLADNIVTGQRLGLICHHYRLDQHQALDEHLRGWLHANA